MKHPAPYLVFLIAFLFLWLNSAPASAQGAEVCYSPQESDFDLQRCFPQNSFIEMPVGAFRVTDNGATQPVIGIEVQFLHTFSAYTYVIDSCVTDGSGICKLQVPEEIVGALSLKSDSMGIDPVGYAGVYENWLEQFEEMIKQGIQIEDAFAEPFPYMLTTEYGQRALILVAPSPGEQERYSYHWVLYMQESPQAPFVRNKMGRFAPSAEILPDQLIDQGDQLIEMVEPVAAPDESITPAPAEPEEEGLPIWVYILVAAITIAILLLTLRLRLLLAEK